MCSTCWGIKVQKDLKTNVAHHQTSFLNCLEIFLSGFYEVETTFLPKNATESDSMTVTKWTLGVEVDVTSFIYIFRHFNQSTKRSSSTCSDDSISNFSSRPWSAPPWMLKIIELSWAGPRLADWLTQIKSRWIITFAPCVFSAGRRQSADRVSVGELWSDGGADQRRLP